MSVVMEQCVNIKFCYKLGKQELLKTVYDDNYKRKNERGDVQAESRTRQNVDLVSKIDEYVGHQ